MPGPFFALRRPVFTLCFRFFPGAPPWLRRLTGWLVSLMLLCAAGAYAYFSLKRKYTVVYDSYTTTRGSISNALSFSGNLALIDSASYTAGADGTVRRLSVAAGDSVKAGDALLRLSGGQTIKADFDGVVNAVSVAEGDEVYVEIKEETAGGLAGLFSGMFRSQLFRNRRGNMPSGNWSGRPEGMPGNFPGAGSYNRNGTGTGTGTNGRSGNRNGGGQR